MQPNNLKYTLLDKLISVQDASLLEKVNEILSDVDVNKSVFKTTEEQRKMLLKSEEDIRSGHYITDEELNEEEDEWLNG